eukprot:9081657-Alexandrium_andersonii.AAC.1
MALTSRVALAGRPVLLMALRAFLELSSRSRCRWRCGREAGHGADVPRDARGTTSLSDGPPR